eukprot:20376-Eustigmatos_ZCMA.PRE.1
MCAHDHHFSLFATQISETVRDGGHIDLHGGGVECVASAHQAQDFPWHRSEPSVIRAGILADTPSRSPTSLGWPVGPVEVRLQELVTSTEAATANRLT